VQVGLAFTVGLAAFALAALVSPHLRDLDGDAVFVLGIFILMAVLVTEIAARAGRRVDESEQARGLLVDEQAALRRVATLVAREASPAEVFSTVTEELGRLLGTDMAALIRFEPGNRAIVLAVWNAEEGDDVPAGTRISAEDSTVAMMLGGPAGPRGGRSRRPTPRQ